MAESDLDIIEFVRPFGKGNNLYVTNISNRLTESTVSASLYRIFSQFGLLYEVQVLGSSHIQPPPNSTDLDVTSASASTTSTTCISSASGRGGPYAFVKFYSTRDARKALQDTDGKYILDGRPLKVKLATRQKPNENHPQLGFKQCCELANYYLGFNGWTSEIVKVDEDSVNPGVARFIAVMKISVRHHGVSSEGIGVGEVDYQVQEPTSKITAYHRAQKIAVQRASEGAFRKLIIVVLPNGKVAVDVNCTWVEEQHFATQEELKGLIEVNQIDEACPSDEEADIEGVLDVNDTRDLDEMNAQMLLDLQLDA